MRQYVAFLICFLFVIPIKAQERALGMANLPDQYQELIKKIDAHMNSQRTMQSRFVQLDGAGGFTEGTLSWRRPDQARFEYDPPSPLLLIASGNFLIEVDLELEQVSHYPQIDSVADYLLGDDMLQNPKLQILEVLEQNNMFRIKLQERDEPENGEIILLFDATTYDLKRWTVLAPDNSRMTVTLIESMFNIPLDDELFHFRTPRDWITTEN